MTFTQAFIPAYNRAGESKLIFKGFDSKSGKSPKKDKEGNQVVNTETGEIEMTDWTINNLTFDCVGRVFGTFQKISIRVSTKYSPDNTLGKVLASMGWKAPSNALEEDEDGFGLEYLPEDEDGFGQTTGDDIDALLTDFFASVEGKAFAAKVIKDEKGWYKIDTDSLRPL